YVRGVEIDWAGFDRDYNRRKVVLPTYPFQRRRYWVTESKNKRRSDTGRPLIDKVTKLPLHRETVFETEFSLEALPFLADHRVHDVMVSPAACQLAMVFSAAEMTFGHQGWGLRDVVFPEALVVPEEGGRTVQAVLTTEEGRDGKSSAAFQLISFSTEEETEEPIRHATGRVMAQIEGVPDSVSLDGLRECCAEAVAIEEFYQLAAQRHIALGPRFRWLIGLWQGNPSTSSGDYGQALGHLRLPEAVGRLTGYVLHPGLLDTCFQVARMAQGRTEIDEPLLTYAVTAVRLYQPVTGREWWCHAQQVNDRTWDIQLLDDQGQVLVEIVGFEIRPASPETVPAAELWRDWLYEVAWQPRALFGRHPDYLPAPKQLQKQLTPYLTDLLLQTDLESYAKALAQLEAVSLDYVLAALAQVGFNFQVEARWRTEQMAHQLGVLPRYHRLLDRLLVMLAEVGILTQAGESWQIGQMPEHHDPQSRMVELRAKYGALAEAELTLLERCGARLGEVLRGVQDPLELLFPGGDADTVTRLYQSSPGARVMNGLVQQAVLTAIEQLPAERGVRILEIGAGTGGTTAHLLPYLPAEQTEYCFTDIGPRFIAQAREKFGGYDFVRYQTLDIEQPPVEQGFGRQQYDIVIAANVLHATRDLTESLSHVQQLLAPGGLLVLLEATARRRWVDLTFGLTDGWWRFGDIRRDHPLLTASQWQELLLDCGFQAVSLIPDDPSTTDPLGQTVITAQASELSKITSPSWLILADETGVAEALAAWLKDQGHRPTLVFSGDAYEQLDEHTFRINPELGSDYRQLLDTVWDADKIVHLWSLDIPNAAELTIPALHLASKRGCGSTLFLIQALANEGAGSGPKLWAVTRGAIAWAHSVESTSGAPYMSAPGVAQSPLWGMGKVIALEHPELWGGVVDLSPDGRPNRQADEVALLWAAIENAGNEDHIALRKGRPYVARLTPITELASERYKIRADGTYLITGGLGYLGLNFAQWLVGQGARHLVLLGRSEPSSSALEIIAQLNQKAQLRVLQADVSNQADMARVFETCQAQPPLRGIIHAAGILGNPNRIQALKPDELEPVFRAKTAGSWLLHRMSKELDLDFFVMFSSAGAVWGAKGQAFYDAANHFLDTLAYYRRSLGLSALSINWGMLAGERTAMAEFWLWLTQLGMGEMSPAQGCRAVAHLLSTDITQAVVTKMDWGKFKRVYEVRGARPLLKEIKVQTELKQPFGPSSGILQRLQEAAPHERANILLTYLQGEVARTLQSPQLPGLRQGFFDLGIDSLMAIELTNRLNLDLGMSIPTAVIFDFPTIWELAQHLSGALFSFDLSAKDGSGPGHNNMPSIKPEPATGSDSLSRIRHLSERELEDLVNEKLARLGD
ncbi:MAG: SDR family NAD(P)-dependent oxidoreductase, partial [Anaerolineae bacterium]|nr:SDR family NAD(P)-dependent oxidoreductase [Anaerolineae bacterium]